MVSKIKSLRLGPRLAFIKAGPWWKRQALERTHTSAQRKERTILSEERFSCPAPENLFLRFFEKRSRAAA